MKPKLKVFEEFSNAVLPHEARYVSTLANFQDAEKQLIFDTVINNALNPDKQREFNPDLDKRKYHHIKTWIEKKLDLRDVDKVGARILDFYKKISLDLVTAEEEKEMIDYIKAYKKIGYNFQQLYNVVREYRSYLLVRLRYDDHLIVDDFLRRFESAYKKANKIHQKLYEATDEITSQYTRKNIDSGYWEKWLMKVFETEDINGNNRYKAFVLLAFMYNTNKDSEKLRQIFAKIDGFFSKGDLYSRRILYNFYSNSVLLHSQLNDNEKAIYFGKLAIRQNNEDTLMYVNNLAAIYLRTEEVKKASELLENYRNIYESTHNDHQKITYISYHLRILDELKQHKKAENIGIYFLQKYEKEIFEYRWHHFFTSYINILLETENYPVILQLEKKFGLRELEGKRKKNQNFIPNISWAIMLASYMENKLSKEDLLSFVEESLRSISITKNNAKIVEKNVLKLSKNLPVLYSVFKSHSS